MLINCDGSLCNFKFLCYTIHGRTIDNWNIKIESEKLVCNEGEKVYDTIKNASFCSYVLEKSYESLKTQNYFKKLKIVQFDYFVDDSSVEEIGTRIF